MLLLQNLSFIDGVRLRLNRQKWCLCEGSIILISFWGDRTRDGAGAIPLKFVPRLKISIWRNSQRCLFPGVIKHHSWVLIFKNAWSPLAWADFELLPSEGFRLIPAFIKSCDFSLSDRDHWRFSFYTKILLLRNIPVFPLRLALTLAFAFTLTLTLRIRISRLPITSFSPTSFLKFVNLFFILPNNIH